MTTDKGGPKKRATKSKDEPEKSRWRVAAARYLRRGLFGGAVLSLMVAIFVAFSVGFAAAELPSFNELKASQNEQTIVFRARDGTEIVALGPSYGKWLTDDEIPPVMKNAMIAVEDRRFNYHFGVDPIGLARAVYVAATGNGRLAATSTITQQLARNLFLNSNRSLNRKAREAILAMALEWKFSKEQILELYLNKVYFGGGAYGIDSASRKFFSHPGQEITAAEAAIIAGLVKAPSRYAPTANVEAAIGRAQVVLRLMKEQGKIASGEVVDLSSVKVKQDLTQNSVRYFIDWILPQLDVLLPESNDPIEVWTTVDLAMQNSADAAILANTPKDAQGALVTIANDGAVRAMIGGTNYAKSSYNRATEAMRQPGSAWKLFVYLTALESGYAPTTAVNDAPITIDGWAPRNSGGGYAGEMDLRTAFALSKNTVAAQIGNELGFRAVAAMARRFGITSDISIFPSMVLGTSETRLIEMTRAFAAISAGGNAVEPYGIVKVVNTKGQALYTRIPAKGAKLISESTNAGITDLLQAAVATGTGRTAQIGRPIAGKTGTTTSNKDGYFVGFSSGLTTGVWMGRDDSRAVPNLQGGRAPAKAFADHMRNAVKNLAIVPFNTDFRPPDWQLEGDQEQAFGEPGEYYYIDENGDLVLSENPTPNPIEGEADAPALPPPSDRKRAAPPAAGEEFLNRAVGREGGENTPRSPGN